MTSSQINNYQGEKLQIQEFQQNISILLTVAILIKKTS
jgi:hypothetical protein